jgi:integrase
MSVRPPRQPAYRLHKPSGQAVVTLNDHDHYLGKWNSPESRTEYDRLIAEWLSNRRQLPPTRPEDVTVSEIILAYWRHVEHYYRHPDSTPTTEVRNIKIALRRLRQLYGQTPATAFNSLALEALRDEMIRDGLCRNRINKDVARVKQMFRWAASKRLVPDAVHQSLATVGGLRVGRSAAKETAPVKPVADAVVEATLPHLSPQVATMVRLQRLTGMRPGEVVVMRTIDLDTSGSVWLYRPGSDQGAHGRHKNAYRGHDRVVPIGPKAQETLKPWLRLNLHEFLFQPREAEAWRHAERRKNRKTPMTPSQAKRQRKKSPKKAPGSHYSVITYDQAIGKACAKGGVPHWHPNQLRHAKATELRREVGLEAARVVLGHRSPRITEVYAELDVSKAAEVMEQLG